MATKGKSLLRLWYPFGHHARGRNLDRTLRYTPYLHVYSHHPDLPGGRDGEVAENAAGRGAAGTRGDKSDGFAGGLSSRRYDAAGDDIPWIRAPLPDRTGSQRTFREAPGTC